MEFNWKIKAVQLDLARQMETLDFIKDFIDLIKSAGHNTLFLYLEGRVRTTTFNMPPDNECYNENEMRDIVGYATSRDIDVIPCVSLHGHAELFLQYKELADFSELRNNAVGRFGESETFDFCPSHEGFKKFMASYLEELCEIFPSQYFHMGLDEVWVVGFCEKCAPKVQTFADEQQIFLDNIVHWYGVLAKLGKRAMMWDDIFEYYPDILEKIPRDVIMVEWQYQNDVRHFRGHFMNLPEMDWLQKYDNLGFEYLIAPSDYSTSNIRTATEYANKFNPLGGLVTSWGKKNCFVYKSIPSFVYAGILWNGRNSGIFNETSKLLFASEDTLLVQALQSFGERRLNKESYLNRDFLLNRAYFGLDYADFQNLKTILSIFESRQSMIRTKIGEDVQAQICAGLRYDILAFELKIITQQAIDVGCFTDELQIKFAKILKQLEYFARARNNDWQKYRTAILPSRVDDTYKKLVENLRKFPDEFNRCSKLRVRFFLPDQFGVPITTISLQENGSWQQVANGTFKSANNDDSFYEITFLTRVQTPEAIEISVKGYGGQGVCFAELHTDAAKYVPDKLELQKGECETPEFLTDNDCKWIFLGNRDTSVTYQDRSLAEASNSVVWTLVPKQ